MSMAQRSKRIYEAPKILGGKEVARWVYRFQEAQVSPEAALQYLYAAADPDFPFVVRMAIDTKNWVGYYGTLKEDI